MCPGALVDIDAEVTVFPMRQGPNNRRPRGRNSGGNRRPNVPNRNQTFDSNGPDVRIRGNAYQVYEKYLALARDATASGDRVMAENYLQHAEHYHRIILSMTDPHHHAHPSQPQPGEMRDAPVRETPRDGAADEDDGDPMAREPRRAARDGRSMRQGRDGRDGRDARDNGGRAYARGEGFNEPAPARADGVAEEPAVADPRDANASFIEFGSDPRTADARDGDDGNDGNGRGHPQSLDEMAAPVVDLAEMGTGGDTGFTDDAADEESAPRAPRRRRGAGRHRRTASGAATGDLGESAGDDEQADLGI